jgi:outer membrane immunogenic protein
MKRLLLGVAAVFIITTGQAVAEGLPPSTSRVKAPGASIGPSWNGFYVGAGIGAGVASYDISGTQTKTRQTVRKTDKCKRWSPIWLGPQCHHVCTEYYETVEEQQYTEAFSDSGTTDVGVFGVVTVGFDRVLRQGWVGGVFADYDFGSGISGDVSVGGVRTSLEHNSSWAVGARLGHLLTPSTMVFGTAGYTQAELELSGFGSHSFSGYFVGAGVETFLQHNWTLKLEYRYSQFDAETFVDGPVTADVEPSMHTARLVLSYKLGDRD